MKSFSETWMQSLYNKKTEIITFLVLLVSLLWLKEINFLFYSTLDGPDFDKYIIYLEHFFSGTQTNKEHGLLYYYLHSLHYSMFYSEVLNLDLKLDKSIQQVNFYIFISGLLGYYLLLRFHNFSNKIIFLVLTFVNFFPPSIAMRLVLKPEILAFAYLPWIILLIEKFKKEKEIKYIYFVIPVVVSTITQKGNVLVIVGAILFLNYARTFITINKKHLLLILSLTLASVFLISSENTSANGKNIFDIQSGSAIEEKYDYKADYRVIYKVDIFNLISKPEKHTHADSFIAITLLETTGDYFDLLWNNDASNYYKNRKNFIKTEVSQEIRLPQFDSSEPSLTIYKQRNSDRYPRKSAGLIVSIFLYGLLVKTLFKNKEFRRYLLYSIVGMGVLLFHSITGLPKNNFDPLVGDTFKPMYYSFVLIFSFAFLVAIYLKNNQKRYLIVILYCLVILFILGFPKTFNYEVQVNLVPKIQSSAYCELEKNILLQDSDFSMTTCNNDLISDRKQIDIPKMEILHKPVNLIFIILNFSIGVYLFFKDFSWFPFKPGLFNNVRKIKE
jgi:hypothetical protein